MLYRKVGIIEIMFMTEDCPIIFQEGLNDRFDGYYEQGTNITSDIQVDNILNNTPYNKIWFGTDWHLYLWDKEKKTVKKNPDAEELIQNQINTVDDHDVFIFLGDLTDDECQNYEELAHLINYRLKGYKILILGNNDLQPENYYISRLGFNQVFQAYQWDKFTFSHKPLKKFNTTLNIHGHMHEWWDYTYEGVTYNNMIKLYTKDFNNKPINLERVMNLYDKGYFSKNVK